MNKFLAHGIYRQYIALARGESFTPSEIGETFLDAECLQLNYFVPEGDEKYPPMSFDKPGVLTNKLICSHLRLRHGAEVLSQVKGFNSLGEFILPRERGLFFPVKENGLIVGLRLADYK